MQNTSYYFSTISAQPMIDDFELEDIEVQLKVIKGSEKGYECIECQDFHSMSELNFPEDTNTPIFFKCYACRHGLRGLFK